MRANPVNRNNRSLLKFARLIFVSAILALSFGCSPAPSAPVTELPIPVTGGTRPPSPFIPTKTRPATNTPLPSAIVPPTRIPQLALVEKGFSAWCYPMGRKPEEGPFTSAIPVGSLNSTVEKDLTKVLVPSSMCGFIYRFNQPIPLHMYVLVYQDTSVVPWLKGELIPAPDDPKTGVVIFRHEQITNPNAWEAIYVFSLRMPLGQEISSNKVDVYKLKPARCKSGLLPDPVSLACPEEAK